MNEIKDKKFSNLLPVNLRFLLAMTKQSLYNGDQHGATERLLFLYICVYFCLKIRSVSHSAAWTRCDNVYNIQLLFNLIFCLTVWRSVLGAAWTWCNSRSGIVATQVLVIHDWVQGRSSDHSRLHCSTLWIPWGSVNSMRQERHWRFWLHCWWSFWSRTSICLLSLFICCLSVCRFAILRWYHHCHLIIIAWF